MAREMTVEQEREDRDQRWLSSQRPQTEKNAPDDPSALDQRKVEQTRRLLAEQGAEKGSKEAERRFGSSAMGTEEGREAQRQVKAREKVGNRQREMRERAQADTAVRQRKSPQPKSQRDRMIDSAQERRAQGRETPGR